MAGASMGDTRFFARSGPHHLAAVAEAARGIARAIDLVLHGVAPLQAAGPCDVSFLDNRRYAAEERSFSSIAIGTISSTAIVTLSPGITISVPSGNWTMPVTSVVRK